MRGIPATISLRIALGHIHVRLLSAPAAKTTADLSAAGSRRAVIVATSKGVRLTTAARATAALLTTTASARRTVVPPGKICSGVAACRWAAMEVTRPVVATGVGAAVGFCASRATARSVATTGSEVATACSATRPVIAHSRATVTLYACSATRPVIAHSRATVTLHA